MEKMPKWADVVLIPLMSLLLAVALSALVILFIGENPLAAFSLMVDGALMRSAGWGYTLYYATNFMFTGLAVSVARGKPCWEALGSPWRACICPGRIGRWRLRGRQGWRRSAGPHGRRCQQCCKPGAAAISLSPPSCSTLSPQPC